MKILSVFVIILLLVAALLLASSSFTNAAAPGIKNGFDAALEKRKAESEKITLADVEGMKIVDLREHLSWRGDACMDCDKKAQLQQALTDHLVTGTPLSAQKYSETSAKLRSRRSRHNLGDNPHGNNPDDPMKRFEARRRKHQDPNDPLAGLKNVLGAHGFDMKSHPLSESHGGQKEVVDFLAKAKDRAKNHDPGRRDPAWQAQQAAQMEKLRRDTLKDGNGDL